MKVEFPKKPHSKRRKIFQRRIEKLAAETARGIYERLGIKCDPKVLAELRAAASKDAVQILSDPAWLQATSSDSRGTSPEIRLERRVKEIMTKNNLVVSEEIKNLLTRK